MYNYRDSVTYLNNSLSKVDIYFVLFVTVLFFLSFAGKGSSIENNIQGIFSLVFSVPVLAKYRKYIFLQREYFIYFSFFYITVLSTFLLERNYLSWLRVLNITSLLIFSLASFLYFSTNRFLIRYCINIFIIFSLIHCLFIIKKWFYLEDPNNYDWVSGMDFFGNIRHVAIFVSIGLVCALYRIFFCENKMFLRMLYISLSIIMMSFIFWSGTRSVFLSLIFVCSYFIYNLKVGKRKNNIITLLIVVCSSVFISTLFPVTNGSLGIDRFGNNSGSGRIEMWLEIIDYIKNSLLLGYGAESFLILPMSSVGAWLSHTHNIILQILIEFGFIGLGIALFIVGLNILHITKIKNPHPNKSLFIAIVINYLIIGMLDGVAYYSFSMYFLGLMFIFLRIDNNQSSLILK